jgi:hypothetical protein
VVQLFRAHLAFHQFRYTEAFFEFLLSEMEVFLNEIKRPIAFLCLGLVDCAYALDERSFDFAVSQSFNDHEEHPIRVDGRRYALNSLGVFIVTESDAF